MPIGVFDSGMGGLTVLRALIDALPHEGFLYLGDTARLPYGTKSAATVTRYALQATGHLVAQGIKALVVACNTASATALPALRAAYPGLPVFGVLAPGAEAASRAARVLVLGTESTVRGGAYQRELLCRGVRAVRARACPLMVTLAEEGRGDGQLAEHIVADYLAGSEGWLATAEHALLLGCTHFPLFAGLCRRLLPPEVAVIDSARTTALAVAAAIPAGQGSAELRFFATDDVDRFCRIGGHFLAAPIDPASVALVDL